MKTEKRFESVSGSKTFRNLIRSCDLDTKEVLDIGCSYGEFLAHFGRGSVGVTLTEKEAEYGRNRGLDIRLGNIESEHFSLEKQFDVIFANNLLEHLYSPHRFLCAIKKWLKPAGCLIVGVPCIPKIVSLVRIRKFQGALAYAHINFFTRETLVKTVERSGWIPKTIRSFHFSNTVVDRLFDPLCPHFYVIAIRDSNFHYHEQRLKELEGYRGIEEF